MFFFASFSLIRRPQFELHVFLSVLDFAFNHRRQVVQNLVQVGDFLVPAVFQ